MDIFFTWLKKVPKIHYLEEMPLDHPKILDGFRPDGEFYARSDVAKFQEFRSELIPHETADVRVVGVLGM